ncbi:hypothetical protein BT93_A1838 [Corymbia citriodora subsp. variegata]|nr:hypothetical protein BT93_A1838 [Corymbia citriodora subsp. variegata]
MSSLSNFKGDNCLRTSSYLLSPYTVGRTAGSNIITEEVLASCSGGPHRNEQFINTYLIPISFCGSIFCSLFLCVISTRRKCG